MPTARSIDTIIRDTLGNDRLTEIQMRHEIETLQDRVRELESKYEPKPVTLSPAPPPLV